MTCVTCHDPHRSSFDPDERQIVRNACIQCHESTEPTHTVCLLPISERSGKNCVDCHMRRTGVFDVAHVKIHDHFIRTDPGPPSQPTKLRVKESRNGNIALFEWPGEKQPAYADDPGLWMMAHMACGHNDLARPFAEREPGPASSRLATYYHLRGVWFEWAKQKEEAQKAYTRALELDPDSTETAVNYGLLLGVLGKTDEGIAMLDAVIAEHPSASPALRNRAILRFMNGDKDGFVSDLEGAFEISPDPTIANTLSDYFGSQGERQKSARWAYESVRLDPSRGTSTVESH